MSRPYPPRSSSFTPQLRVNGRIRAREVRVIGVDNQQIGVLPLGEALTLARQRGVDLVEVAATATPPVCRLVDFGKFRYEQAKREKESKKHQHANRVKEIQLSASIDAHDFATKLGHAVDFLCEEMKVKATLRFRGREMAHKEFGFQTMSRFTEALAPYGHPDAPAKLVGRNINVMFSPLPRNKRAKNPRQAEGPAPATAPPERETAPAPAPETAANAGAGRTPSTDGFANNPFASLEGSSEAS